MKILGSFLIEIENMELQRHQHWKLVMKQRALQVTAQCNLYPEGHGAVVSETEVLLCRRVVVERLSVRSDVPLFKEGRVLCKP